MKSNCKAREKNVRAYQDIVTKHNTEEGADKIINCGELLQSLIALLKQVVVNNNFFIAA